MKKMIMMRQIVLVCTLYFLGLFCLAANAVESESGNAAGVEVIVETSKGVFTIELYPDKAPKE